VTWDAPTLWWLAAGALVAVELATGSFYLLMLALGAAAAALAAHAGFAAAAQVALAALVGGGATVAWHLKRQRSDKTAPVAPAASNRDVNLDVGETVSVQAWGEDGTARVQYRGSAWTARYAGTGTPGAGLHRIAALHGNELRLVAALPN
jgi:membrane protein implicated in regulation of membrane protease activity